MFFRLKAIIEHAHSQRNSVADVHQRQEAIVLSEKMAEDLFKYPWISKARGSTVHLLKSSAKTVRQPPKRKKYPLLDQKSRGQVDLFAGLKKAKAIQEGSDASQIKSGGHRENNLPQNQSDVMMK